MLSATKAKAHCQTFLGGAEKRLKAGLKISQQPRHGVMYKPLHSCKLQERCSSCYSRPLSMPAFAGTSASWIFFMHAPLYLCVPNACMRLQQGSPSSTLSLCASRNKRSCSWRKCSTLPANMLSSRWHLQLQHPHLLLPPSQPVLGQ